MLDIANRATEAFAFTFKCWNSYSEWENVIKPADTGRNLNVRKTFRRRPGRVVNVLFTFNLRPVSMGNAEHGKIFLQFESLDCQVLDVSMVNMTEYHSLSNLSKCYHYPVDTGRKLNLHKTFRRRAVRLLNVLCVFNLRPVSMWQFDNLAKVDGFYFFCFFK